MFRNIRHLGSGLIALGAFSVGVFFERNKSTFELNAEIPAKDPPVDLTQATGDFIDSPSKGKKPVLSNVGNVAKHGLPSSDSLRSYPNFVLSYDRKNRIPHWVLEHITPSMIKGEKYDRSKEEFYEDTSFHQYFRASNRDYRGSGYDRGHLAAAGNYRSAPDYVRETFVLSNVAPQVGNGFNRHKWNDLERYVRKRIMKSIQGWVCTGPLFLPRRDLIDNKSYIRYEVIGNNVAVPTHFFKVILTETAPQKYTMESFIMPNVPISDETPVESFRVNPEVIERSAGVIFFSSIPRKQIYLLK